MLDFLIESGVQGLQGFQPECGMLLEEIVTRRTREGEPLVIFGPLAVTTEVMLRGSVDDVVAASRKAIDDAAAGGGFILSTGDQCGRDTPDANVRAMIDTARTYGKY